VNSFILPGIFTVWRRNLRQQSSTSSYHTYRCYIWADVMFQRRKPWAVKDTVCIGSFKAAKEAGSMSWCCYLLPFVLVW